MQDAEEPNLSTEMFGIPGDLEQSLGAGAEQKTVDFTLVLQRQRSQLMRQCEDHMDVRHGQKVPAARSWGTVKSELLRKGSRFINPAGHK